MTEFLPRSAWTADPKPSGATLLTAADLDGNGFAIHWPGSSTPIGTDRAGIVRRLQGYLKYHTDPEPAGRGWSDIAYQYAVDQAGRVWELRGVTRRSAANGDTGPNRHWGAVLCLVGEGEQPTAAMVQAVRDLRQHVWLQRWPRATRVVRHTDVRPDPTKCPGDALSALVRSGAFTSAAPARPAPAPQPSPPEVQDMKVIRTADGRQWITNGPLSAPLATPELAAAWCRLTGQLDADGNPKAADVPYAVPASTTSTATLALIQTLAAQAANRPGVDVGQLAVDLAPLLHLDVPAEEIATRIAELIPDEVAQDVADLLGARLSNG